MKAKALLFAGLLLLVSGIKAQKPISTLDEILSVDYKFGYAILEKGDTLIGYFEFNDCPQNYEYLVYANEKTKKKELYEPAEVKYFALDNILYFPRKFEDKLYFMRLFYDYSLKLYIYKHYYTTNEGNEKSDYYLLEKPTGESIMVQPNPFYPFKTRLSEFFGDCPELKGKIDKGVYDIHNMAEIVRDYNNWLVTRQKK